MMSSSEILNSISYSGYGKKAKNIHFVAGSTLVAARKNKSLRDSLNSGYVVCDSTVLGTYLSHWYPGFKNLRGADFLRYAVEKDSGHIRHCFIFSDKKTEDAFRIEVTKQNKGFKISSTLVSIFSDNHHELVKSWISQLDLSSIDVIWIGLGSPKQDLCAREMFLQSQIPCIAIGAALQFYSKTAKEAPRFVIAIRLEWFFRLINDFSRLWRRYTFENFQVVKILILDLMSRKVDKRRQNSR